MMQPCALIIACAALSAPAAALAHDGDVRTTVVRVGDLDLASSSGVDRLIRQLRGAIDGLCDTDEACRDEAWLSADWQIARQMADAQWRRRIADERAADRMRYRGRREEAPMLAGTWRPPSPPPLPPASPVGAVTTTTTTITTIVTVAYRAPPPDDGWHPR